MPCYDGYITIDNSTPSRSGLYVTSLPGVELNLLSDLTTPDQANYLAFWDNIYKRAWDNLVSDVANLLNEKFFVDLKLVSRETSDFLTSLNSSGIAGVRIEFTLPKYARLHIIDVELISDQDYDSPDGVISIYEDDVNGDLLHEVAEVITEGKNTINIDTDFDVNSVFVSYDSQVLSLKKTENKNYYSPSYNKLSCTFPCQFGQGGVRQINGGGLNVTYVVYCSIEKFVCENINLFKQPLLWRIGNEIIIERRYGNTVNCFTAMTPERAEELTEFYQNTYSEKLDNAIKGHKINEDPFCFNCKNTVTVKTVLP